MVSGKDLLVSMPHAALLVVQGRALLSSERTLPGFNAARGFVGGASIIDIT